jgi:adenylate cyclase
MQRKLAAILAADVVAYSALMERDEAGTFDRLRIDRKELFEPEIEKHYGRIFKLMGDGLLAEFGSVVDAVECAVSLQRGLAERNAKFPDEGLIQVRIGINLGEVIIEGDDCYGEGVNIASRLEQLAEPGGICVSGKVAREVEKKLAFGFEFMGDQQVKNMAEAVSAYRVVLDGLVRPKRLATRRAGSRRRLWAAALGGGVATLIIAAAGTGVWLFPASTPAVAGPPTVAVLPLSNVSGDPSLKYFADGATETLISDLARSPEIRVISRTSSDAYGGKALDVRQIGKELNATYIVEGSIQKSGATLRIVAQLIDARSGEYVWAQHYDKEGVDPLAMQDEVATKIVGTLAGDEGLIKRRQFDEAWGKDSSSLDEYSYYLRGHELLYRLNKEDTEKATQIWAEGLEKFPTSSLLKVKLGIGYYQLVYGGWSADNEKDYTRAAKLVREGLAERYVSPLAKTMGHLFLAWYNLEFVKDYEQALRESNITLALAPSDPFVICNMALVFIGVGKTDAAIGLVTPIQDLKSGYVYGSPQFVLGRAYFVKGDYARAADFLNDAPADAASSLPFLAASYAENGKIDHAKATIAKALKEIPTLSVTLMRQLFPNQDGAVISRQDAAMRKAGLPEA